MKKAAILLILTSAALLITACEGGGGGSSGNGAARVEPNGPSLEKFCNLKGVCLTDLDLLLLRRNAQPRLKLEGADLIRLQAVALGDAYEKQFGSPLSEEDNAFIGTLFTKIFEKE